MKLEQLKEIGYSNIMVELLKEKGFYEISKEFHYVRGFIYTLKNEDKMCDIELGYRNANERNYKTEEELIEVLNNLHEIKEQRELLIEEAKRTEEMFKM